MAPKTAFEKYLQDKNMTASGKQAVVFFEANTDQPGMSDFRPMQLAEGDDGPTEFQQGDGWMVNPKGLTSTPTSTETALIVPTPEPES